MDVQVLLPEHRDRIWRDRYGYTWSWVKWADQTWDWGMRDTPAVPRQRCFYPEPRLLVDGFGDPAYYRAPFTELGPYVPDPLIPTVEVTRYQVSCLPADHIENPYFSVYVERRSANPDRWAVTDGSFCYDQDGRREYESIPSSRTDEFIAEFRHTLEDALTIAKKVAPNIQINGHTPASVLARGDE